MPSSKGHPVLQPGLYVGRVLSHTDLRHTVQVASRCFPLDQYPAKARQLAEDWRSSLEEINGLSYFVFEVSDNKEP